MTLICSLLSLLTNPQKALAEQAILEVCLDENSNTYRENAASDAGWVPSQNAAQVLSSVFVLGNISPEATPSEAADLKSWADDLAQETFKGFGKFLTNGRDAIVLVGSPAGDVESCSYVAAEPFFDSASLAPEKDKTTRKNGLWRARTDTSQRHVFFHAITPNFEAQIAMPLPYKMVATRVKDKT